jgi:hypothetical protein
VEVDVEASVGTSAGPAVVGSTCLVFEPNDAPLLSSGIEQERNEDGSASTPHPSWKSHPMQGWSPDFIAKLAGDAISSNAISEVLRITNADAMRYRKELAKKEGIFVGITSGGRFAGALLRPVNSKPVLHRTVEPRLTLQVVRQPVADTYQPYRLRSAILAKNYGDVAMGSMLYEL